MKEFYYYPLKLPPNMEPVIKKAAKAEHRSINSLVEVAIDAYIKNNKKKNK